VHRPATASDGPVGTTIGTTVSRCVAPHDRGGVSVVRWSCAVGRVALSLSTIPLGPLPTMSRPRSVFLSLMTIAAPLTAQTRTFVTDSAWLPIQIEHPPSKEQGEQRPNIVHLRNGHRLKLPLFEVEFLGQLPRPRRPPLLVVGGRECFSCDAATRVYIVPSDADSVTTRDAGYHYPGTLRGEDSERGPFYKGRMFIGRCLGDGQPLVVWFQSERDSTGSWHAGVHRVTVVADSVRRELLQPRPPIAETTARVRSGVCYEVPGIGNFEG